MLALAAGAASRPVTLTPVLTVTPGWARTERSSTQSTVDLLDAMTVRRSSPARGDLSGSDGGICVCSGAATAPARNSSS